MAELVSTVPQIGPERYRQIRVSTFVRVRAAGFPIWPTNRYPHFSLVLPDLHDVTLARLDASFDRPQASPALPGG